MCSPRRVLDLPPINIPLGQLLDVLLGNRTLNPELSDEGFPNLFLRFVVELFEMQRDVDAREEGGVEGLYAVRG